MDEKSDVIRLYLERVELQVQNQTIRRIQEREMLRTPMKSAAESTQGGSDDGLPDRWWGADQSESPPL